MTTIESPISTAVQRALMQQAIEEGKRLIVERRGPHVTYRLVPIGAGR